MPPSPAGPPARGTVLGGGSVGLIIGVLLLSLSVFFLFSGAERHETLGVFLPLAVVQIALSLGVMALVPFLAGDSTVRSPRLIAGWLVAIAVLALAITIAAVLRATWPWALFSLAPLLVAGALVRSAVRFARVAGA